MSVTLAYVGAILLAYEILGEVSHFPTFFILVTYDIFKFLIQTADRWSNRQRSIVRIIPKILTRVIVSPIIIVALVFAAVILVLWVVGTLIKLLDSVLNMLYRFERRRLAKEPDRILIKLFHPFLPDLRDEELVSIFDKIRVPFVGFIGMALLTTGFVIDLVTRQ